MVPLVIPRQMAQKRLRESLGESTSPQVCWPSLRSPALLPLILLLILSTPLLPLRAGVVATGKHTTLPHRRGTGQLNHGFGSVKQEHTYSDLHGISKEHYI